MQIAFGLRLTEYTLELARHEFRLPLYFPRERASALPCARAFKKFHHREPQVRYVAARETKFLRRDEAPLSER